MSCGPSGRFCSDPHRHLCSRIIPKEHSAGPFRLTAIPRTPLSAQELSAEAARLLAQRLDADGSGTVSFDEWIKG